MKRKHKRRLVWEETSPGVLTAKVEGKLKCSKCKKEKDVKEFPITTSKSIYGTYKYPRSYCRMCLSDQIMETPSYKRTH